MVQRLTGLTILLIDDDDDLRNVIQEWIQKANCIVTSVNSVDAAIDALDASKYDLIITDLKMPGGDGIDLLTTLRKAGCVEPVLVMSGYDVGYAFDSFLMKPFTEQQLMDSIYAVLGKGTVHDVTGSSVSTTAVN